MVARSGTRRRGGGGTDLDARILCNELLGDALEQAVADVDDRAADDWDLLHLGQRLARALALGVSHRTLSSVDLSLAAHTRRSDHKGGHGAAKPLCELLLCEGDAVATIFISSK